MQAGAADHITPPDADPATNLSPRVPKVTLLTLPHVRAGHKHWSRPAEHRREEGEPAEQAHETRLPTRGEGSTAEGGEGETRVESGGETHPGVQPVGLSC